ncbi:MAG: metalloregulator ArsR/SmtB family transcription factor [Pseudomonadota bacterium]
MFEQRTSQASDNVELEAAAQAFAALGSEQRLAVLRCLVRAGPDGLAAGELARRAEIGASTLTHHLRFLTQVRLVVQTRQGRSVICAAANHDTIAGLARFLVSECCADAPQATGQPTPPGAPAPPAQPAEDVSA